jgi:hypothetical protein
VQCVEINRMVAAPPANPASIQPAQLFYANNQPSGAILPCNVLVNAGDFIGVLGACGTTTMHNSYGPLGTFASSILGNPVTLTRLLMQNNLSTTGGNQPCSSEPHGPIGRVEVYIAPAAGAATAIPYGTGCVARHTSFYEDFANAAAFDLSNTAMTMINNGSSYTMATGLNGFVAPSANAVSLNLTDDSQTTVQLAGAFPYPGGTTTALTVCSNGFVSVANGNGTPFTPAVSNMLAFPQTAWGDWHDYLPAGPGPVGQVMFEQIGNVAYVTWNAVNDYGNPVPNTWQLQFDRGNGSVHFALQAMSLGGNGHLVFHSPGGPSLDPGNRDISATLAGGFATSPIDIAPLTLTATTRPVSGTNCNMLTANIPAASPFGAVQIGLTQYDPGIDLGALGMATCRRYADGTATLLFVGAGPTATLAFAIPPGFAGLHVYAQSLVFCPAAGLTVLGAISSNGLDLGIGNQ